MVFNKDDFNLWLDQWVWVSGNTTLQRRKYIPHFANELTVFMKRCGYTMDRRWNSGALAVAKWMYAVHLQEYVFKQGYVQNPKIIHRNLEEDYSEYLHVMDFDKVSRFIEIWRLYEDFDKESPIGQKMLNEITEFLYCYIDIDMSEHGRNITELLYETDSDGEGGNRRDDVYITDSREGYHGGDGYKV